MDLCWDYVGKLAPWKDSNIPEKHFKDVVVDNSFENKTSTDYFKTSINKSCDKESTE